MRHASALGWPKREQSPPHRAAGTHSANGLEVVGRERAAPPHGFDQRRTQRTVQHRPATATSSSKASARPGSVTSAPGLIGRSSGRYGAGRVLVAQERRSLVRECRGDRRPCEAVAVGAIAGAARWSSRSVPCSASAR